MITVAIVEDEAAVTRKLTNMAQDGKTWEMFPNATDKQIRKVLK